MQNWIRGAVAAFSASSSSTSARTVVITTTAGGFAYCWVGTFGTAITVTVSGSVNGSYTQIGSYKTSGSYVLSLWTSANTSAGTETITVTPSATAYVSLVAAPVTNITTSPNDANTSNSGNSTTPTTGTCTVSGSDEMLIGCQLPTVGVSQPLVFPNSGVNMVSADAAASDLQLFAFDANVSANSSIGITNAACTWVTIGASFIAVAGGGGGGSSGMPPIYDGVRDP